MTLKSADAIISQGRLRSAILRAHCRLPADSIKIFKQAYEGLPSYSLQNLRQAFNLEDLSPGLQAHRAAADVEWTVQLLEIAFTALLKKLK